MSTSPVTSSTSETSSSAPRQDRPGDDPSAPLRAAGLVLLLAVAYFVGGRLGLMLPAVGSSITLLWPPTGIAVGALWRYGLRCWPGVLLGAVAVNLAVGSSWPVAVVIAAGNTLAPVVAVGILRRWGFQAAFDRTRDIALLAAAAALGMTVSASVGTAALSLEGPIPGGRAVAWLAWWAGDAMGVILAAPLMLALTRQEMRAVRARPVEFLAWAAATGVAVWVVFVANGDGGRDPLALAFVLLPFIAWAALRLGAVGTSFALIVVSIGAAYGTARGTGPFSQTASPTSVVLLWTFMLAGAAVGWLITALHSVGLKASETQRLLEHALSDVSLGVLIGGVDRRLTYVNAGFTRLTGYSDTELLGKSCRILQGPGTDPATAEQLDAALRQFEGFDDDILNYRKDGTPFWNALLISPVYDDDGRVSGFLGVQRDITKQKEAELALRESRSRLDAIVNSIDNVVYSAAPDGASVRFISASSTALYGRPAAELITDPTLWIRVIHPEDRPAVEQAFHNIGDTGEFDCEYRIVRADGTVRWVHDRARVAFDGSGRPERLDGVVTDITERRTTDHKLRENAERLELVLSATRQGLYDRNEQTGEMSVSPEYARMLGYDPESFHETDQKLLDRLHPDDLPAIAKAFTDYAAGRSPEFEAEFRQQTKTGEWRWIRSLGRFVQWSDDGRPLRLIGTHIDITDRRRAEEMERAERAVLELLSVNAPLHTILERLVRGLESSLPGTMCSLRLLSQDGAHLLCIAPSLPEAFRERISGSLVDPEALARNLGTFGAGPTQTVDIALGPIWQSLRDDALASGLRSVVSAPVVGSTGELLGAIGAYRLEPHTADPAEIAALERGAYFTAVAVARHTLLQSLQDSQVRLHTLVANLPGMAYRCHNDEDWTMTYVSEGSEALTGYRPEELESNRAVSYNELVHPDDREWLWAKCQASLDAHVPCQNEYRIWDRQGRERWVSERASGSYGPDGQLLFIDGFIQDVTESRRARLEREELERKMLETQKLESLGVLAGGIAHDFNNILTAILGHATLGLSEVQPGDTVEENLVRIVESSQRAADLCRQMLAYSGKGRFVVRKLDLGRLVESTTQMLRLSISKSAVLRFQFAANLPPIEADATQIRQVIMNLVINASEAIGDRSGVISLFTGLARVDRAYLAGTVTSPELPEGDYVFVEVGDSGVGMSPETQSRIFDPFFSTKFTGRGLGLAAVLGIIRGHKGALKVYSEVGRGTTFRILFPAAAGLVDAVPDKEYSQGAHGSGTILVVDDEETVRTVTGRMGHRMGFDVVLAADGDEAVRTFSADPGRFVMVLLDLTMPHRDGEQTFTALRQLRPDVRVVLMSGFSEQEALVRFTGKGLASFLQKPFTFEQLGATVRKVLA